MTLFNMQKAVHIGGLTLIFRLDGDVVGGLASNYAAFMSCENNGMLYRIRYDGVSHLDLGVPVFDGQNWTYHLSNENPIIRIGKNDVGIHRWVFATKDFQKGDVYCVGDVWGEPYYSPLGYPLVELLVLNALSKGKGVMFHACGVNDHGKGYIFTGRSGAGKSTLAQLWAAADGVSVLSDERVIVRQHDGRFWVYGTPWYGDAKIASPEAVPLERIFVIDHAPENQATPLKPGAAASELFARSFPTFWDADGLAFTLEFLGQMSQALPCYALDFVPDAKVIDFVRCVK